MAEHPPVELQGNPDALLALQSGLVRLATDGPPKSRAVLCSAAQGIEVRVDGYGSLAFKFEVFPLEVSFTAEDGTSCDCVVDWPFKEWRVDVLRRLEWLADPSAIPPLLYEQWEQGLSLPPGETPPGTEHSCWVADGLLFTGSGKRLLIAVDAMPMDLLVSDDAATIARFVASCIATPVEQYAADFLC